MCGKSPLLLTDIEDILPCCEAKLLRNRYGKSPIIRTDCKFLPFRTEKRPFLRLFGQLPVEGVLAQRSDDKKDFLHRVSVVYGLTDLICFSQLLHGKGNIINRSLLHY